MPNWNEGYVFNALGENDGFFWNGADYVLVLRLNEVLKFSDNIGKLLAKMVLLDKMNMVYDGIISTALFKQTDKLKAIDDTSYSLLWALTDEIGITDEFSALLVLASLKDNQVIIDQAKQVATLIKEKEFLDFNDDITVEAFLNALDRFGLKELSEELEIVFNVYDRFGMTDGEPKQAISDFIIGVTDDNDPAYDWLIPFNLKIDWDTTLIQVMPEASITTIEMPGIDGSIVEDTVYKDRLFQIVAFSQQGLTISEKEDLKRRITEILDATKHTTKKLTVQTRGTSFDVKYEGQATITEGPSYVKATIPFRTSPYGYETFEDVLDGSGLITNDGDAPNGVKHIITGPITNPSFSLDGVSYRWSGNVPSGSTLVIDHAMMTCYLQDRNGIKTNALSNLRGTFQKIPPKTSVVLNADSATESKIRTEWKDRILW